MIKKPANLHGISISMVSGELTNSTATTKRKGRIALWFANEMISREEHVAYHHVAMNVKAQPTI